MDTYSLAPSQPPPAAPAGPPPMLSPSFFQKYKKYLIIGGIVLGFLVMFLLGLSLSGGRKNPVQNTEQSGDLPTVTPNEQSPTPTPASNNPAMQYLPGKQYFDDSIAILTKNDPHQALFVAVSRLQQTQNYTQYARVNYFNGAGWQRDTQTATIPRPEVINNPLITNWMVSTTVNQSSRNTDTFTVVVDNKPLTFTFSKLSYDISTRSFDGYTKFVYFGEGTLKTPDDSIPSYVLYTKTFAANAFDLAFQDTPEKIESDWLVFWDSKGNAYHVDTLASDQANKPFQNLTTGVIYYANGSMNKMANVRVQRQSNNTGQNQSRVISQSPNFNLDVTLNAPLNKATSKTYTWPVGIITGTLSLEASNSTVNGVGLMESTHKVTGN